MANVEVTLDKNEIILRVKKMQGKATEIISNELLKDSNYFAREDTGELIRSSIRASRLEEGELIWDTPYAKRMYYVGNPSKDTNPNASLMWAQKAADKNKEKYQRMIDKLMG